MSDTTQLDVIIEQTLQELHLPTTPDIPNVCRPGDSECLARLIQAYSDCD